MPDSLLDRDDFDPGVFWLNRRDRFDGIPEFAYLSCSTTPIISALVLRLFL